MKSKRGLLYKLFCLLPIFCLSSIQGASKEDIQIYFNGWQFHMDEEVRDYVGGLDVKITADRDVMETMTVAVSQEGIPADVVFFEGLDTLAFHLEEGENYAIDIDFMAGGQKKSRRIDDVYVYDHIPVFANEEMLADRFESEEIIRLQLREYHYLDMGRSYIRINDDLHAWKREGDTYVLFLEKEGIYDVQFHFFDMNGKEYIQTAEITKEYKNKEIQITAEAPVYQKDDFQYYRKDVELDFYSKVIRFDRLSVRMNDTEHYIDWQPYQEGYRGRLTLQEEGSYEVQVYYQDEKLKTQHIILDKTSPMIEGGTLDLTCNPSPRPVNVQYRIQDENMDVGRTKIEVFKDGYLLEVPIEVFQHEDTLTYLFRLEEDGMYTYRLTAMDMAGNERVLDSKDTIEIDTVFPHLVLRNKHLLQNTNQDVEIEFAVSDSSLNRYILWIKKDGVILDEIIGTQDIQKIYRFHEERGTSTYELQAVAWDRAGNETVSKPVSFVIDKEKPQIEAFLQGTIYQSSLLTNASVPLLFRWQDPFCREAQLVVYKNGECMDVRRFDDVRTFRRLITALQQRMDEYRYVLRVYDLAGNMAESTVEFVIDTYLPPLRIKNDIFQGKASNQSWTPLLEDVGKHLTVLDVKLLRDQKEVPYRWGDEIQEEGTYQLHVIAADAAGNVTMLAEPFFFVIDKSAPWIYLRNVDTMEEIPFVYEGSSIHVTADTGMFHKDVITSLKINGEQQLQEDVVQYAMHIEDPGDYQIDIAAKDEAGNQSQKTYFFTIQKKPVFYESCIWSLPATLLMIYFGIRQWKKHADPRIK